jgi:hypothetical protein
MFAQKEIIYLVGLLIAFDMSSKCILVAGRRAFTTKQFGGVAAFVSNSWYRIKGKIEVIPIQLANPLSTGTRRAFLSTSPVLSATVPSASEILDFGDLDYKNGLDDASHAHKSDPSIQNLNAFNDEEVGVDSLWHKQQNDANGEKSIGGITGAVVSPETADRNDIAKLPDDLDELNASELKEYCRKFGLKVSGKKADLQERLRDHIHINAKITDADPVQETSHSLDDGSKIIGAAQKESPVKETSHSPVEHDQSKTMGADPKELDQLVGSDDIDGTSTVSLTEIESQPKPDGNWNPDSPLEWCKTFGSRSATDKARLEALTCLKPGDEGYFDVSDIKPQNVTLVRTKEQARLVMKALMKAKVEDPERIHACDTEVMDIDLKEVGPVGHGYVTCLSVYSGEDFDYGLGDGPGTMLWVDNLDDAKGILYEFQEWLEDPSVKKVWHNYGFDRHVIFNEGIDVKGFGGDTMHMARLSDTSRMKYSLESLTEDLLGQRKVPMKEIFGVPRLRKDGSPGAIIDLPAIEVMQREPKFRENWIKYSAFDAKSTYNLYEFLKRKLIKTPWIHDLNMFDYYKMHMRPFGELLTDLERRGMLVAKDYLADVETKAREDRERHVETFRQWAYKQIGPDGLAMNTASSVQLSTFLFGGSANAKTQEVSERVVSCLYYLDILICLLFSL